MQQVVGGGLTKHNTVTDGDCDIGVDNGERDCCVWLCWVEEQLEWDGVVHLRLATAAEVVGIVVVGGLEWCGRTTIC